MLRSFTTTTSSQVIREKVRGVQNFKILVGTTGRRPWAAAARPYAFSPCAAALARVPLLAYIAHCPLFAVHKGSHEQLANQLLELLSAPGVKMAPIRHQTVS